jgi:hypothetical protein
MVVRLLTSVLLLVLPSLVYGSTTTIKVRNDSGSLQLSSSPDKVNISGSLTVNVSVTGVVPDDLPLTIEVADNLLTPVYEDRQLTLDNGILGKSVPVTFSSSSQVPLQEESIHVRVSITFDGTSVDAESYIIDNRGEHIKV